MLNVNSNKTSFSSNEISVIKIRLLKHISLKMARKTIFTCVLLLLCNEFKLFSSEEKEEGWFARDRNYTSYCHGGDFESGAKSSTGSFVCTIWVSNESRCTLKYVGGSVYEKYLMNGPPAIILPNDCGVFTSQGPSYTNVSGLAHYMCEEYGVIIAIKWNMPWVQRNRFSTRVLYFNRAKAEQMLSVDHEGSATGNKRSMNVFISEQKRYCPCDDYTIYSHIYK